MMATPLDIFKKSPRLASEIRAVASVDGSIDPRLRAVKSAVGIMIAKTL
jgi:hypothetical protein